MNKERLLKEALERLGIHTQKDFKKAVEETAIDISIMAADQQMKERLVG